MSEQEINQIVDIIEQSFLQRDEKDSLKKMLIEEGTSIAFFNTANQIFSQALRKQGAVYNEIVEKFDMKAETLDREYRKKVAELEETLDAGIEGIDATDLVAKEDVFDKYYSEKERLEEEYQTQLKTLTAQLAMYIIQNVS